MQNRTPVPRNERPPLPDFTPVPRQYRHDGWTPERQKAFIEALADTGSVTRAARMVNIAQANCYALRRAPGAEGFRRAWEAALDFGVQKLKDIAFERAIEGELIPVFVGGKLMGHRRKHNDALLMFCLRHYGQDAEGRRTTINYFSSRGAAGVGSQDGAASAQAEASATTIRTVIHGTGADGARTDALADAIQRFDGVTLDAEAEAAIRAALDACAARRRIEDEALDRGGEEANDVLEDDPATSFVRTGHNSRPYRGTLEAGVEIAEPLRFGRGEAHWRLAGAPMPEWAAAIAHADGSEAIPDAAGGTAEPGEEGAPRLSPGRARAARPIRRRGPE